MKTVLIFDTLFETPIRFRVVEGDMSHLNQGYVNHINLSEEKQDELMTLLYKDEDGNEWEDWSEEFPTQAVIEGAKVVVVGFLP